MVTASDIERWILSRVSRYAGEGPGTYGPGTEFADIGLSSRDAVVLIGELQDFLGRELSPTLPWDYPNARALASHLGQTEPADGHRAGGTEHGTPSPEVAVVGMACRFPGAPDAGEFWALLEQGRDGLAVDAGRDSRRPQGLLPGIDMFDAGLFGISDAEAAHIDPQQRLVLETAWQALEDAAIGPGSLAGSRTGVFVGVSGSDYARLPRADRVASGRFSGTGEALSITANRVSYALDLRGVSLAVDTACSSSLMAVHLAVQSLRSGESDLALAGAVNVLLAPEVTEILAEAGMLAADGRCKSFDAAADGYVRSEGCGLVVLKRLPEAIADGDRILGVIAGSAAGQDGRTNGLTAPSGLAQQELIRRALRDARMEPGHIGYVEAHGTGTSLGDPIEVGALCAVFASGRDAAFPLLVGSAKANIGHAEAAAGIAGLIKILLMLSHRRVPGQAHLRELNPRLGLAGAPVTIAREPGDWVTPAGRALAAGVSSFGFGGTGVHVIVREPPAGPPAESGCVRLAELLVVSASSETALAALAGRYAGWLAEHPGADLGAMARTTARGRAHLRHRAGLVVRDRGEAVAGLASLASQDAQTHPSAVIRRGQGRTGGQLAMLFSGQGAQYLQMGRQLYVTNALFRGQLRRCQELLADDLDVPLLSVLFPLPSQRGLLDRTRYTQPALVALQYSLAQVWRSWGVTPDFVLGHSVGEYAAACVAGVLDLADTLRLVAARGRLIEECCEPGAMAVAFAGEDVVGDVIAGLPADSAPVMAAVNARDAVVVAGSSGEIAAFVAELSALGADSRPLKSGYAFHSPMMRPAEEAFASAAGGIEPADGAAAIVSDLDGRLFAGGYRPDSSYWVRHLTSPVRFAEGIKLLAELGCSQFLEVGPGRTLAAAGRRTVPDAEWLSSLRPGIQDWAVLQDAVACLYAAGRDIDWDGFHRGYGQRLLALPGYPFERRRHWLPVPAGGRPDPGQPSQTGVDRQVESHERAAEPVLAMLSRVLGTLLGQRSPVDPDRPFLELGADSMALFQLLQTVQKTYSVIIAIGSLFEELNTLRTLAEHISASLPTGMVAGQEPSGVVAGQEPSGREPSGVPQYGAGPGLDQFLQVHAQVMNQAYELLRGGGASRHEPANGAAGTAPRGDTPAGPRADRIAMAAPGTFVAFRADAPAGVGGLTGPQAEFAGELLRRYTTRTRQSADLARAERPRHSDVRHAFQAFPDLKEIGYPVAVDRSLGARVWDVDGNEYIDLTMGFGVNLFGHQEPFIIAAIADQLSRGMQLGPHTPLAADVTSLICDMTGQERAVFCNTGSEAVMVAVRLARAVTGRQRIALFAGAYHGSADPVLARQDIERDSGESVPMAPGITQDIGRNVIVLPYGEDDSLEVLREHAGELAAVLVEPVQSRAPGLQPVQFLRRLRELTEAAGVPLIFDEVITGFRTHPGGVQALFGIKADITTYGKVIGGGLPIGVVAGDARYLNAIDGGAGQAGDGRRARSVRTFFTGTFAKHPLALAAAKAVLTELGRRGPALQENLSARATSLAERLNAALAEAGVAIVVTHFGSQFRFSFAGEPSWSRAVELFYTALLEKGLYIWEGRNCFLSTAHTDADLDEIVSAVALTAKQMAAAGFFTAGLAAAPPAGAMSAVPAEWPLSRVQQELWLLHQLGADYARAYFQGALLELHGQLDAAALRWAVAQVLDRHESLHAVIGADGSRQRVVAADTDLPLVSFTDVPGEERPRRLDAWLEARARDSLDLAARPPVRMALLRLADDEHRLYLAVHHVMIDGWSFDIVLSEVMTLYDDRLAGRASSLPAPVQYREHVAREQEHSLGSARDGDARYWQEQFAGGVPELILPADSPRSMTASHRLGTVQREIGADAAAGIQAACSKLGVTPFTVMLAAYCYLLHLLSGQDDLVVGVPFARRGYPGGDRVVGNCSTTIPVRSRLVPGALVRDHIAAVHATLVAGHQHPDFSIAALREGMRVGDGAGGRIFAAGFNLDRASTLPQPRGLAVSVTVVPRRFAQSDLAFDLLQAGGRLSLTVYYRAGMFTEATAARYALMFDQLLMHFIAEPQARLDQLAMQLAEEAPRVGGEASTQLNGDSDGTGLAEMDAAWHVLRV
jgi:acyl transferase domain-containing protein/glutamate-1-semialdehyde aminotransferase